MTTIKCRSTYLKLSQLLNTFSTLSPNSKVENQKTNKTN